MNILLIFGSLTTKKKGKRNFGYENGAYNVHQKAYDPSGTVILLYLADIY